MAHHPRRPAHEDGSPKFWLLFFLGLVIVLVLFRAFVGAVEGTGGFADRKTNPRKRRRAEEDRIGLKGRKDSRKSVLVHNHAD